MKFPSAAPGPPDQKKAWSCLLSNLAMPGVGSLTGGRGIGCGQLIFGAGGFALTMIFGLHFIFWWLANRDRLAASSDPAANLAEAWLAVRLAVLGMAVFATGLLWALFTSLSLIRQARRAASPPPLRSVRR